MPSCFLKNVNVYKFECDCNPGGLANLPPRQFGHQLRTNECLGIVCVVAQSRVQPKA